MERDVVTKACASLHSPVCPSPWWNLDAQAAEEFWASPWSTFSFLFIYFLQPLKPWRWRQNVEPVDLRGGDGHLLCSHLRLHIETFVADTEQNIIFVVSSFQHFCRGLKTMEKNKTKQKVLTLDLVSWEPLFSASADCRYKLCSIECIDSLRFLQLLIVGTRQLN